MIIEETSWLNKSENMMQDDAMPISISDQASPNKRSKDSVSLENSANSRESNNQLF
jgi:hypothetical protein